MEKPDIHCIADVKALLGEGPLWVEAELALYWVDIKGRKLCRFKDGRVESWDTPLRVGSVAPRSNGGYVCGTEHGFMLLDAPGGVFAPLSNPEEGRPSYRFNDGKVGRDGAFWAGSMDDAEQDADGTLYRLDSSHVWTAADRGYTVTNGPAFSPDGTTLYHNDSGRQTTYAFDLGAGGELTGKRVLARYAAGQGYPDGMTVDAEGCLWIAFWDGWCVRRVSPQGEIVREVAMPVQRPTSCGFGGMRLDRLFVTSARIGLDEADLAGQREAGCLFVFEPGVQGMAERPFAG